MFREIVILLLRREAALAFLHQAWYNMDLYKVFQNIVNPPRDEEDV